MISLILDDIERLYRILIQKYGGIKVVSFEVHLDFFLSSLPFPRTPPPYRFSLFHSTDNLPSEPCP